MSFFVPLAVRGNKYSSGSQRLSSRLILISSCSAVALCLGAFAPVRAQDLTWDPDVESGEWDTGTNWLETDPTTGEIVVDPTTGDPINTAFSDGDSVLLNREQSDPNSRTTVTISSTGTVAPGAISFGRTQQWITGGTISSASAAGGNLVIDFTGTNAAARIESSLSGDFTAQSTGNSAADNRAGTLVLAGDSAGLDLLSISGPSGSGLQAVTVVNEGSLGGLGTTGDRVANSGTFENAASGTVNGDIDNTGQATLSGTVNGSVTNGVSGTMDLTEGLVINGNLTNTANSTSLNSSGAVRVNGIATNAGQAGILSGMLTVGGDDGSGTFVNGIVNNTGSITVGSGAALNVVAEDASGGVVDGQLTNSGSSAQVTIRAGGTIDADLVNENGGSLVLEIGTNVGANVSGNVTNRGATSTIEGGGTVDGRVTMNAGTLTPTGLLTITGMLDINATVDPTTGARTAGVVEVTGGDLTAAGVTNAGDLTVGTGTGDPRTLTISGANVLDNEAGGVLTVTSTGTVVGTVTNRFGGEVDLDGRIVGSLTTAGEVMAEGRVAADATTGATGDVTVEPTGRLRTTDALVVEGTLDINATVDPTTGARTAGVVEVTGGDLTAAGVTNAGDLTVGDGNDTVVTSLSGGQVTNEADGVLNVLSDGTVNASVVSQGEINAQGGAFRGGVRTGGTFNLTADTAVTGEFINSGIVDNLLSGDLTLTVESDGTDPGQFTTETNLGQTTGGRVTVDADIIVLGQAVTDVDDDFVLDGAITNYGIYTIDTQTVLAGNYQNLDTRSGVGATPGRTIVTAAVDANGFDVTNGGDFDVAVETDINGGLVSTGSLTNVGVLTNNDGGTFDIAADSRVEADEIVNEGDAVFNNQGTVRLGSLDFENQDGTLQNSGNIVGTVDNHADGVVTNTGTITGDLTSAGTVNAEGEITGQVVVNDGDLTTTGLLRVGDTLDINADSAAGLRGRVRVTGGNLEAGAVANGGDLEIGESYQLTVASGGGAVVNEATGQLDLDGQIAGNLDNSGTVLAQGGVVRDVTTGAGGSVTVQAGGDLTTTGLFTVDGALEINAGTTTSAAGAVDVTGGNLTAGSVTNGGDLTVGSNQTLSVTGGNRTVDNEATGVMTLNGGTVLGSVSNSGAVVAQGTIRDNATHSGTSFNLTGELDVGGTFRNEAAMSLDGGDELTATRFENASDATLTFQGGALLAEVDNDGTISGTGPISFGQMVNNSGAITAQGNLTFNADVVGEGGSFSVQNGSPTDRITFNSSLSGTNRFVLDIEFVDDIDPATTSGRSDQVVMVGAAVTGNVVLEFSDLAVNSTDDAILAFNVDETVAGNSFDVSAVGLPAPEQIIFSLDYDTDASGNAIGDIFVVEQVNPALGAIAGNVALTQSLIGSIINRPSSPFVTGLAYEDQDPCGFGGWGRAIAGQADATGATTNDISTFASEISASYTGLQVGGDLACFGGLAGGWDLAFGAIGGINTGTTTQPVFAVNAADPTELTDTVTSITDGEFDQYYGGIYLTGARGRLTFDLQYRLERTDYLLTNNGVGGLPGLDLADTEFSSDAQTLSGAVSYAIPLNETGLTLVPTAGFAWTQTETEDVVFGDGSVLELDDSESRTAFVGASLSRTVVRPSGDAALNQFVTATFYNDFADDLTSTFSDAESATVEQLVSTNLGSYYEISAGINYLRLLDNGQFGNARQMNLSVRADYRTGDTVDSWGVTAQARIQF